MTRKLTVLYLGRSVEPGHYKDMNSYRVSVSEGSAPVVFEARITLGTLETLDKPEDRIKAHYATAPLPNNGEVVDLIL